LKSHSPSYYFRKRLFANPPAVFGMIIIGLLIIIAILGYWIMPDDTPFANERADEIAKQKPGFRVTMLKIRKNRNIPQNNIFYNCLFGQESIYNIVPIEAFRIDETKGWVYVRNYGRADTENSYPLADVVYPLYVGKSKKLPNHSKEGNFLIENNQLTYLDLQENIIKVPLKDVIEKFNKENIERRYYLLGTDKSGRDMLSRLLLGVRISLGIGIVSVTIATIVGLLLGSLAGFLGGFVDKLIVWFMTVVWSIPGIMLVIAISLVLGKGIFVTFLAIGLTSWVDIARTVRGQVMSLKEKPFIEATKALGMSNRRIIIFHILPNIIGPLLVVMTSNFASAILTEAGLSFLGLSVQPPASSWGIMVNEGFPLISTPNGFYLVLFPALSIAITILAFNLFGNGLRDAYDVKNK
jgi:peptide/nickel transport system permease protein